MRTTVADAASLTTSYADNRVLARVGAGPLAFLFDIQTGSSQAVTVQWEFSHLAAPSVSDDTHWYTPIDQAGAVQNTVAVSSDGRFVVDLGNLHPGTTAGNFFPSGVPSGVSWMRVSAKIATANGSSVTIYAIHNPGPASSTATVSAS